MLCQNRVDSAPKLIFCKAACLFYVAILTIIIIILVLFDSVNKKTDRKPGRRKQSVTSNRGPQSDLYMACSVTILLHYVYRFKVSYKEASGVKLVLDRK